MSQTCPEPQILPLSFNGERMMPFQCPQETEAFHWQRYLYFRSWYEDSRVIDAGCGEGYGANYVSIFAKETTGLDFSAETVAHATNRYPDTSFHQSDVAKADYSGADVVLAFDVIQELSNPGEFLQALSACKGKIAISTPNRTCWPGPPAASPSPWSNRCWRTSSLSC